MNSTNDKTNEIARLREALELMEYKYNAVRSLLLQRGDQLDKAIEIADGLVDPFIRITGVPEQQLAKLKTEARLAPAPEEPATEESSASEPRQLERENAKLREIVERYRVWSTSENPTQMELDDLKQKYDELN
jgi:hypothetical protein